MSTVLISSHADHRTCDHDYRQQLCDRQKLWGGHDRGVSSRQLCVTIICLLKISQSEYTVYDHTS